MASITTKDGTGIYYNDWGDGQPVVFSHGYPLSADAFEDQIFYLASRGYRCIAHDRRGHGWSSQPWTGNDMNTYADDLAELVQHLGLDKAIQVGHSTGGGEVARYIARHGTQRVARAVLISAVPPPLWPATDASVDTESYHEFATGRFLGRAFMAFGWDTYVPNAEQRNDPHVSPLRATVDELKGLPPAFVMTEENDPLRDEGEAYAHKLDEAGVTVIATRYIGQIHDFGVLNGIRDVPSTQEAIRQASAVLKEYLNQ